MKKAMVILLGICLSFVSFKSTAENVPVSSLYETMNLFAEKSVDAEQKEAIKNIIDEMKLVEKNNDKYEKLRNLLIEYTKKYGPSLSCYVSISIKQNESVVRETALVSLIPYLSDEKPQLVSVFSIDLISVLLDSVDRKIGPGPSRWERSTDEVLQRKIIRVLSESCGIEKIGLLAGKDSNFYIDFSNNDRYDDHIKVLTSIYLYGLKNGMPATNRCDPVSILSFIKTAGNCHDRRKNGDAGK